jgi:hypothetical protein
MLKVIQKIPLPPNSSVQKVIDNEITASKWYNAHSDLKLFMHQVAIPATTELFVVYGCE